MEHRSTIEVRTDYGETPTGKPRSVTRYRYVCACGYATRWFANAKRAEAARETHALDGQLDLLR